MSTKKPMTPLERGTRKLDVLMRAFGMRTRVFKGKTRSIVKGTRKLYPFDVHASVVETARGIGIKIGLEKIWYTFLKFIPFFMVFLFAILELSVPSAGESIANATGVNLFHLIIGPAPKPVGIIIVTVVIGLIIVFGELAERIIRVRYLQNRMPRFLSGAEWKVAEPPVMLDAIGASNNILWLMYVTMIFIYAPLSFSEEIYTKFLEVYKTESALLIEKTTLISMLDIGIISGMLIAFLLMKFKVFRTSLDREQFRADIKLDSTIRDILYVVLGSLILTTFEFSMFYVTFWSNIQAGHIVVFYAISVLSSVIGTLLVWQNERYIFIALPIWMFLSDVIMIFLNANNPAYSWMIICHLFLILMLVILALNLSMEKYLQKKGIMDPSWIFSPMPIFAYIGFWAKRKVKVAAVPEKEWEELQEEAYAEKVKERPLLKLNIEKIRNKGPNAEKIVQLYFKIVKRIVKGELNIIAISYANDAILKEIKEEEDLYRSAQTFISTVDHLLWDENYSLSNGDDILKIGEEVYKAILKR